jgi:hypothetical protein
MIGTLPESYHRGNHTGTPTPPVTDSEMWRRLLNLLFWLERDDDFRWAKTVKAAVCHERDEPTNPPERAA